MILLCCYGMFQNICCCDIRCVEKRMFTHCFCNVFVISSWLLFPSTFLCSCCHFLFTNCNDPIVICHVKLFFFFLRFLYLFLDLKRCLISNYFVQPWWQFLCCFITCFLDIQWSMCPSFLFVTLFVFTWLMCFRKGFVLVLYFMFFWYGFMTVFYDDRFLVFRFENDDFVSISLFYFHVGITWFLFLTLWIRFCHILVNFCQKKDFVFIEFCLYFWIFFVLIHVLFYFESVFTYVLFFSVNISSLFWCDLFEKNLFDSCVMYFDRMVWILSFVWNIYVSSVSIFRKKFLWIICWFCFDKFVR